jgi:hypothetical protein
MTNGATKTLIWVPIVHSQADLGSVGESLRSLYGQKVGKGEWERRIEVVEEMWQGIRNRIERLELDYRHLRLYQDGLPECGHEAQIVEDLAKAGSQNHQLVLDLMAKGAELMGTESPELLLEEYGLVQQALKSLQCGDIDDFGEALRRRRDGLLRERDQYIAGRIGETLHRGETGLIFLGLLHSLREHLPQDVRLITLVRASSPCGG